MGYLSLASVEPAFHNVRRSNGPHVAVRSPRSGEEYADMTSGIRSVVYIQYRIVLSR